MKKKYKTVRFGRNNFRRTISKITGLYHGQQFHIWGDDILIYTQKDNRDHGIMILVENKKKRNNFSRSLI